MRARQDAPEYHDTIGAIGVGLLAIGAGAFWISWNPSCRASPGEPADAASLARSNERNEQVKPPAKVHLRTELTDPCRDVVVQLADGTLIADARFELIPSNHVELDASPAQTKEVSTNGSGLLTLPATADWADTFLKCRTFGWLPAVVGSSDPEERTIVIAGGRLDVLVQLPARSEHDVYVRVRPKGSHPADPRTLVTRGDDAVRFYLVDQGDYVVHAKSADGRMFGQRSLTWSPGTPSQVIVRLDEPGSGVLDVTVVDDHGGRILSFALEVEGPDLFRRTVHSEDLPFGAILDGLPPGRINVELINRIKPPASVYGVRDIGARKRVRLETGAVEQLVLETSLGCRARIHVDEVQGDWELQEYGPASTRWSPLQVSCFTEDGGMSYRKYVSAPGSYLTPPLKEATSRLRFVPRVRGDAVDAVDAVDVDVVLVKGAIAECKVTLR